MLTITPSGNARLIYDDALRPIMDSLGTTSIRRASHVEPGGDGRWLVDMSPMRGPVLGPFDLRSEALAAERAWLEVRL